MFDSSLFLERLLTIFAIFFAGVFLYWLFDLSVRKLTKVMSAAGLAVGDSDRRISMIAALIRTVASVVLFFIGGSMILKTLQIDIAPLLAGAGILGVLASLSAQTLLKDIIAGVFILLENQYAPGMMVRLDDAEGIVHHLSLRSTTLRDAEGNLIYIPNGGVKMVRVTTPRKKKSQE